MCPQHWRTAARCSWPVVAFCSTSQDFPPPCVGTADALRVSLGGVFHCDANAQGSHLPPTFPLMVGILCPVSQLLEAYSVIPGFWV